MERADHFPAQDCSRWRGQELRHPSRAPGRFAARNPESRQGHSLPSRKAQRRVRDKTRRATQGYPERHAARGKTAAGTVVEDRKSHHRRFLAGSVLREWITATGRKQYDERFEDFGYRGPSRPGSSGSHVYPQENKGPWKRFTAPGNFRRQRQSALL